MGNPFDRLDRGQYAGKVTLGAPAQISTSQDTTSTSHIGTVSVDLSGSAKTEAPSPFGVVGTALGAPIDLAVKGLGGLGEVLQFPQDVALKAIGTPQRRIARYRATGDRGSDQLRNVIIDDEKKYGEALRSGRGIVASASGIKYAASTPENLLLAATGASLLSGAAPVVEGLGTLTKVGRSFAAAGKIISAGTIPQLASDDPKYLSDGAKSLIRSGANENEVWDYIHKNGEQFSPDLLENLAAAIVWDPLNFVDAPGKLIQFSGKIGAVQDVAKISGKTFDEIIATSKINGKPIMSQYEVGLAKKLGILGTANRALAQGKQAMLERFRGPVIAALANEIGIERLYQRNIDLEGVDPSIAKEYRRLLNTGLLSVQHPASKAALSQNVAENARTWAEALFEVAATEGIAGLKKHQGLRGLPDSFYEKWIKLTENFKSNRQEETTRALQMGMDMLEQAKNIGLLNRELSGPWMQDTTRLAFLGKLRRGSSIAAARLALMRSAADHEVPIQKALEQSADIGTSSTYVSSMITRFVNAVGDKGGVVERMLANKFNALGAKHAAAISPEARADIIREITKEMESLRLVAWGKAIEIMRPVKKLGGQAAKLTVVTADSLTKEKLAELIVNLEKLIKADDAAGVEKFLLDEVPQIKELAFAYDSLVYAKTVKDDPLPEGRIILKRLRDMLEQEAYVSRIPDKLSNNLDILEWGKTRVVEDSSGLAGAGTAAPIPSDVEIKITGAVDSLYSNHYYRVPQLFKGYASLANKEEIIAHFVDNLNAQGVVSNVPLDNPIWQSLDFGTQDLSFSEWQQRLEQFIAGLEKHSNDAIAALSIEEGDNNAHRILQHAFDTDNFNNTLRSAVMYAGLTPPNGNNFSNVISTAHQIEPWYEPTLYDAAEESNKSGKTIGAYTMFDVAGAGGQEKAITIFPKGFNSKYASTNASILSGVPAGSDHEKLIKILDGAFEVSANRYIISRVVNGSPQLALHEFIANRLFKALLQSGQDSVWYEPMTFVTRVNSDGAVRELVNPTMFTDKGIIGGASVLFQNPHAIEFVDDTIPVADVINGMVSVGSRSLIDISSLSLNARIKLFFDKTRIGHLMTVGINPEAQYTDFEKVILTIGKNDKGEDVVHRAAKMLSFDRPMKDIATEIWMPTSSDLQEALTEWIYKYLSSEISGKDGKGIVSDMFPEFLVTQGNTNDPHLWSMAKGIVEHIIGQEPDYVEGVRGVISTVDKMREGAFASKYAAAPYLDRFTKVSGGQKKFSWADLFHWQGSQRSTKHTGAAAYNDYIVGYENDYPTTLKEFLDNASQKAHNLGPKATTLFEALSWSEDPTSIRVRDLKDAGMFHSDPTVRESQVLNFLLGKDTSIPKMHTSAFKEPAARLARTHSMAEAIGAMLDTRIVAYLDPIADPLNAAAGLAPHNFMRLYSPYGKGLENVRPVSTQHLSFPQKLSNFVPSLAHLFSDTNDVEMNKFIKGFSTDYKDSYLVNKLVSVKTMNDNMAGVIATSAHQSAQMFAKAQLFLEEQKKKQLFKDVENDKTLAAILEARTAAKKLGYELGVEPPRGYLMSWGITRDVRGVSVLRPKYDLYTSIGEEFNAADYGVKQLDQLAFDTSMKTKLQQFASTPISNSELYDTAVERLRVFLGGRISREEALRAFAELTQQAINQEINPGGLNENEVARIFVDAFGGGDKAARQYERVFGSTVPRAALLYALANDMSKIGYSSGFSKRFQAQHRTMATIAQKLFPLARYRYNPIFNQQEGIEPFALTVLRGLGGKAQYEEADLLGSLLAAPGTFRYDSHEVGAHILRFKASIADIIAKDNPGLDKVVENRAVATLMAMTKPSDVIGFILPTGEKMRNAIAIAKADAISITAADELIKNAAETLAAEFPEFRKIGWELTGSVKPVDWMRYLIDAQIAGTIPEEILVLGETAARAYTFGAPLRIDATTVIDDLISRTEITPENLDEIQNIVLVAQKTGASDAAQKELIDAFMAYKNDVKLVPAGGSAPTSKGGLFSGEQAFTTVDNVTAAAANAINHWTSSAYKYISPYLAAKAEYGVQATNLVRDEKGMIKWAATGGKYDANAVGDARFVQIDELVNELDKLISNNRIVTRAPIYRKVTLSDFVADPDSLKVGDVIGMENFPAFSRSQSFAEGWGGDAILVLDNAKGIPGFDIAGAGKGIDRESEVILPRGMKFRVVEIVDSKGTKFLKVDAEMPRMYQVAFDRLAPSDAALQRLIKANNTIKVEYEQVNRSFETLVKLFEQYPAIFDDARRAGIDLGDSPKAIRSVRQIRKKTAPAPQAIDPLIGNPFSITYSRSAPIAQDTSAPKVLLEDNVFGTKVADSTTGMNQGGDTGIWLGKDGVKRYVKRAGQNAGAQQASAALSEFIFARLYRKMGVHTPEVSLVVRNGEFYIASEYLEGIEEFGKIGLDKLPQDVARQFVDNHLADVIANNWDAVGPDGMNVGLMPDGTVVRIDIGNSGFYRAGGEMKTLSSSRIVDLGYFYNPSKMKSGRPVYGYRKVLDAAYGDLLSKAATTAEIPNFVEQFDDIVKALGNTRDAVLDIISGAADDLNVVFSKNDITKEAEKIIQLLDTRIKQLDLIANEVRKERLAVAEDALRARAAVKVSKPLKKLKIAKLDPWHVHFSERLAAQMNNGYRLPGLEEAMLAIEKGDQLAPETTDALGRGLADYIYKRAAITELIDWSRAAMARSVEVASKEQLYNPFKGLLERTLNHPYLGFYPTSYMFGKILPVFANALFKYAPFTGEFKPLYGFRKLNVLADHTAAALEDNRNLQELVMTRTPLINYLNALLPGIPTDVGASLPLWVRDGLLRPIAENKLESIPGAVLDAGLKSGGNAVGPLRAVQTFQGSVQQIQTFLTGDPQKSVLDEISDFLVPGAGN